MCKKMFKTTLFVGIGALVIGVLLFGRNVFSYAYSSAKQVRTAVNEAVPLDFELKRATDLLEEIIPEMHANIKLISQEEVEIAALKGEIKGSEKPLAKARDQIESLNKTLNVQMASYRINGNRFTREELSNNLARKFTNYKEAAMVQQSRQRLLVAREKSLNAAVQLLEKTRSRKQILGDKIKSLESQYHLVQASAVGSKVSIDNSKLAQTEKLITNIKKRLDVAERVLAHESRFVEPIIEDDVIDQQDLSQQISDYFGPDEPVEELNTINILPYGPNLEVEMAVAR